MGDEVSFERMVRSRTEHLEQDLIMVRRENERLRRELALRPYEITGDQLADDVLVAAFNTDGHYIWCDGFTWETTPGASYIVIKKPQEDNPTSIPEVTDERLTELQRQVDEHRGLCAEIDQLREDNEELRKQLNEKESMLEQSACEFQTVNEDLSTLRSRIEKVLTRAEFVKAENEYKVNSNGVYAEGWTDASNRLLELIESLLPSQPGPEEPQGDGYIYIVVVLHNGAEASAKRSPNGIWWWECLPTSGPDHKKYGTWDDLLDHYGRRLPITIVRLEPAHGIQKLVEALRQADEALRSTRGYVGEAMLPNLPGWSHFDARTRIGEVLSDKMVATAEQVSADASVSSLSQCCNQPLTTESGDEGTSFYVCTGCNKPSDPKEK